MAEEDLEQIAELSKDKGKGIKKCLTKLKTEYGKPDSEEEDSEWELMNPKDDDLSYNVPIAPTPAKRSGRGKGKSRRGKTRSRATIIKMKRGRARKKQPKPAPPTLTPIGVSSVDFDDLTYLVGDVVKVPHSSDSSEGSSFAQIQGFYKDQYCEKYVFIRWLITKTPLPNKDYFDPSCFQEGSSHNQPISMRSLIYVMRPPSSGFNSSHVQREVRIERNVEYMDNPTTTLSSADHQWYQFITN